MLKSNEGGPANEKLSSDWLGRSAERLEEDSMQVQFKVFESTFTSWENLFAEAARFATQVGPDRLIGISHSQSNALGVITVWYWAEAESE